jgi:uncharacterized protein YkwD
MSSRPRLGSALVALAAAFGCDAEAATAAPHPAQELSKAPGQPAEARLPSATAVCPSPEGKDAQLEQELREQVNEARRRGAACGEHERVEAGPLTLSAELACAARAHAGAMAARGFFSHVDPEGRRSTERAARHGFHGLVAEDLAWGQGTSREVVDSWLQSPGHCRALMSTRHSSFGIGHAEGTRGKPFWVLLVGQRAQPGIPAQSLGSVE